MPELKGGARSLLRAVAAGLAVMFVVQATPAAAVSAKVKKACANDYKRLCPQYKVGSPQLRACMEAKQYEISSGCVQALIDSGEVNRSSARR
jgi:hypothetical protein